MKRIKILIWPDSQVAPGVNTDHIEALGNYCAEKKPDVIVNLGDMADMASLCSYDAEGEREGKRYQDDIDSVHAAMERFEKPLRKVRGYRPRKVMTLGNHDGGRIARLLAENPKLKGTISADDLGYAELGWEVHEFLKVVKIAGISFSHYFVNNMGRPVSSAQALLNTLHGSAVMGHVQHRQFAIHPRSQHFALFSGVFYTHEMGYLTPQGNTSSPGIQVLHESQNGMADPMFVSCDYLLRQWL